MWPTANSAGLTPVQIVPNGSGGADVWLRINIEQTTDHEGNPQWTADETHGVVSPVPTAEEIEADFDAWWERLESGNRTEREIIADLSARLSDALQIVADHDDAIIELAEIVGGE